MTFCVSVIENTSMLFWGLMLQQKTITFIYLEKANSQRVFQLRMGRHWGKTPAGAQKAIWCEAFDTTPVVSHKSDFKEQC